MVRCLAVVTQFLKDRMNSKPGSILHDAPRLPTHLQSTTAGNLDTKCKRKKKEKEKGKGKGNMLS